MRLSQLEENQLDHDLVQKVLFEGLDYNGESGDLILVLGSRKAALYRVPLAAKLYTDGKAGKVMLSGGKVQDTPHGNVSEYQSMYIAAIENGINERDLLLEKESMTTEENFHRARQMIQERMPECKNIILITTAYHMRRAMLLGQRIMPEYHIIACPANDLKTRSDNWFLTDEGTERVLKEMMSLKWYAQTDKIEDVEF